MILYECDCCQVRMTSCSKEFFAALPIESSFGPPGVKITVPDSKHVCEKCIFSAVEKHFKNLKVA